MLVANRESGVRLSLGDKWEKKELTVARSKEKFYCPECKEEVILKLGNKRIWHFSHHAGSSCQNNYERETEYHLSGKLQLYQWLINQGIKAELEKYDPLIRQKPDIAFEMNGKKYAIEYQCSIIAEDLFIKRTKNYHENGYIPIWIAAASLVKRVGTNTASLSNFLYLFIRRPRKMWNLPAFCPLSNQFINLQNAIPISSRKTITFLEVHTLSNMKIVQLLSPYYQDKPFITQWQSELQKYKTQFILYSRSRVNPFLNELYNNHLNLLCLPPELGLPVFSCPYIETPALIWQTYLYLDVFRYYKQGDFIKYTSIQNAFLKRAKHKQIQLRKLPGVAVKGSYNTAIEEYILLLTRVRILEQIDYDTFELVAELIIPKTVDEQAKLEANFYNKYTRVIQSTFLT